jgi:hypothetical protein
VPGEVKLRGMGGGAPSGDSPMRHREGAPDGGASRRSLGSGRRE